MAKRCSSIHRTPPRVAAFFSPRTFLTCVFFFLLGSFSFFLFAPCFCLEVPISFHAFSLLLAQVNFTGSAIGSRGEIEQMLKFVEEHKEIRPIIERLPMEKANEGIQRVRDGKVRFRVVLENPVAAAEKKA